MSDTTTKDLRAYTKPELAKLLTSDVSKWNELYAAAREVSDYRWCADLQEANLVGTNLQRANLRYANLLGANLQEANLLGADLEGAHLRGANLEDANLQRANLEGANLQRANLRGADLEGANLRYSDLRDANLEGANLLRANLEEADLTGTILAAKKSEPSPGTPIASLEAMVRTLNEYHKTIERLQEENLRLHKIVETIRKATHE